MRQVKRCFRNAPSLSLSHTHAHTQHTHTHTHTHMRQVKVMFLNRSLPLPHTKPEFRPYDLTVVRREQIKHEHFTITAAGVVHITPGEASQFIPLVEIKIYIQTLKTLKPNADALYSISANV